MSIINALIATTLKFYTKNFIEYTTRRRTIIAGYC